MILLPQHEKAQLIGGPGGTPPGVTTFPGGQGSVGPGFKNLMSETPGLMTPFLFEILQKPLASVNLFSVEDVKYENLAGALNLESSIFSSDEAEFTFNVEDLNNLEDIKLLFFVTSHSGELSVELNGLKILSGEITNDLLPVTLPKSLIKSQNKLIFKVKKPSAFEFISKKSYSMKDLTLIETYMVQNNFEVRQFALSNAELSGLKRMTLFYVMNCMTITENGRIKVALNGNLIQDALAVCDAGVVSIDLNIVELVEGRNTLEFFVDKGHYVLENVFIEGDFSQEEYDRYFFMMQVPDVQAVTQGAEITVQAKFLHDGLRKAGAIYVNGFPVYFDTHLEEFLLDVSGLVYEGQNVVTIIPETAFNMVTLDVFIS
tara:strand:+ start:3222 stop:4343 length:1122 start_codon:yes stop_codon:yes gene_type:complete